MTAPTQLPADPSGVLPERYEAYTAAQRLLTTGPASHIAPVDVLVLAEFLLGLEPIAELSDLVDGNEEDVDRPADTA